MNRRRFRAGDPERKKWQDPEQIFSAIGLEEGMVFVDPGCGEGYFALPASRRVGEGGRVYAFDINPEAVAALHVQAKTEGIDNLSISIGEAETTVICEACADIVFFGIDLHDFYDPLQVLKNAKRMLKPSGRLADLDWNAVPMDLGPPLEKRFSIEKATQLIESAGFSVVSVKDAGPYHYLVLAGR